MFQVKGEREQPLSFPDVAKDLWEMGPLAGKVSVLDAFWASGCSRSLGEVENDPLA